MKKEIKYRFIFLVCMIVFPGLISSCKEPAIVYLRAYPQYVCTGETIHFEWHVKHLKRIKILASTGEVLHNTKDLKSNYYTTYVNPSWEYVRFVGCKKGKCDHIDFRIYNMDYPTWTREFFYEGSQGFNIIGGEIIVDYTESASPYHEVYNLYRMVDGYSYYIPSEEFSPRARVLEVKYSRTESGLDGIDPDGMYIEAKGSNNVSKTWVLKGDELTIQNPFHPSATTWYLYYDQPQKIFVGQQFGKPDPSDKPDWEMRVTSLYPALIFKIKCDTP